MSLVLGVALGGALGSVLRYWASTGVYLLLGRGFPYGTLAVNLLGSFLMGLLFVLLTERLAAAPELRATLLVGVLGGFTTFSSFSIETFQLIEQAAYLKALLNVLLSVSLCISMTWLGLIIGRWL